MVAPERAVMTHPVDHRYEPFRLGAVMRLSPLMAIPYHSRELERGKVFRDGRLRDAGEIGQQPDVLFAVSGKPFVNRPAGRIGEGLEGEVGGVMHKFLYPCGYQFVKRAVDRSRTSPMGSCSCRAAIRSTRNAERAGEI